MEQSPNLPLPRRQSLTGPGPLELPRAPHVGESQPAEPTPGEITLNAGLFTQRVPAAGLSVGDIRSRFRARLSIEDRAVAVVDGVEVRADTVVKPGQTLTFVRRAGERG